MPTYYEEETEEEKKNRARACSGLREDLKACLLKSPCVRRDKNTPKECLMLGKHESVPDDCLALRQAFFECKRSILDMRTRFRGRKGY
ncbi:DgyrCDS8955 [Dimorphilus gyrociliatus]|uniref:Cytochrome c oxidase assembly factor 5 n=1 Tax=Dimorphilus gyrociliatus TaxID=2664684 RepID=A0A7I8VVW3_9ANNE|nr:DgyrCDS8955 [Dimorphilus gyrociliatus]